MDIEKIRKNKRKLEYEIRTFIDFRIENFKKLTGTFPNRINIEMESVAKNGGDPEEFVVVGCEINIEL